MKLGGHKSPNGLSHFLPDAGRSFEPEKPLLVSRWEIGCRACSWGSAELRAIDLWLAVKKCATLIQPPGSTSGSENPDLRRSLFSRRRGGILGDPYVGILSFFRLRAAPLALNMHRSRLDARRGLMDGHHASVSAPRLTTHGFEIGFITQ